MINVSSCAQLVRRACASCPFSGTAAAAVCQQSCRRIQYRSVHTVAHTANESVVDESLSHGHVFIHPKPLRNPLTTTDATAVSSPQLSPPQSPSLHQSPSDPPSQTAVTLPGFHGRPLPTHLHSFTSARGRQLFKESLQNGGLEGYFALAQHFTTQSEPAYCGPSTLIMLLNALQLDPQRIWKGQWRWFSEEMLQTCDVRKPSDNALHGVDTLGLSFEEFLFLAECNGASVQAFRADQSDIAKFRAAVHTATSRTDIHLVASFSRSVLGQTGCGHYSPVAGYHAASDSVLILDVARFKYPPYWCPLTLLWQAITSVDTTTGKGRGYYLMSRSQLESRHVYTPLSSLCRIAVDKLAWARLAQHFCTEMPQRLKRLSEHGELMTVADVLLEILRSLPVDITAVFTMFTHDLNKRYVAMNKQSHSHSHSDKCADHTTASSSRPTLYPEYSSFIPPTTSHYHPHHTLDTSLHALLVDIQQTPLFRLLSAAPTLSSQLHLADQTQTIALCGGIASTGVERTAELELATLLLFACPAQVFEHLPLPLRTEIDSLRSLNSASKTIAVEVANLRAQMGILADYCTCQSHQQSQSNVADIVTVNPHAAAVHAITAATSVNMATAPARLDENTATHRFVTNASHMRARTTKAH